MHAFPTFALLAFVPVAVLALIITPGRKTVAGVYLIGWLFLPELTVRVAGLPDYDKSIAVNLSVLLGLCLSGQIGKLLTWRRLIVSDIAMVVWCLMQLASALANHHGWYEGGSHTLTRTLDWGVPYLIGRALFSDREGFTLLAKTVVVGGVLYAPLCIWEARMSPMLHTWTWGFMQHSFIQHVKGGGFYRPMVFLQHGIAVALFMSCSAVIAFSFWRGKKHLDSVFGLGIQWVFGLLFFTTALCQSLGALLLMLLGVFAVSRTQAKKLPAWLILLVSIPVLYLTARTVFLWDGQGLVDLFEPYVPPIRLQSFSYRLSNEALITERAWVNRPWLGWGGSDWGVRNEWGVMTVPDSLWIIAMGPNGLVGLTSIFTLMLYPVVSLMRQVKSWTNKEGVRSLALGGAVVLLMVAGDFLLNAMINPFWVLIAGAVAHFATSPIQESDEDEDGHALQRASDSKTQQPPRARIHYV